MSKCVPEVQMILTDIDKHQRDLHLLFTNDVTTMDITYYNEVVLALTNARERIVEATRQHDIKMNAMAAKYHKESFNE